MIDPKAPDRNMVFVSHANPEDNEFTMWLALQFAGARLVRLDEAPRGKKWGQEKVEGKAGAG